MTVCGNLLVVYSTLLATPGKVVYHISFFKVKSVTFFCSVQL